MICEITWKLDLFLNLKSLVLAPLTADSERHVTTPHQLSPALEWTMLTLTRTQHRNLAVRAHGPGQNQI